MFRMLLSHKICINTALCVFALTIVCACSPANPPAKPSIDIEKLEKLAESGDRVAQFRMGQAYDYRGSLETNYSKAVYWYEKSASQGVAAAQNNLGSMYLYGQGVPQDYSKAYFWYVKSADQGFVMAINTLGYLYESGKGVKQDRKKAALLYKMAAKKCMPRAMINLGLSYVDGSGLKQDYVKAYMWLDLASFYTQHRRANIRVKWTARSELEKLKKKMTVEQIKKGELLSTALDEKCRTGE